MISTDIIVMVHRNGIKVYPTINRFRKFAVCVEDTFNVIYKKKKVLGEYKHNTDSINDAIEKTIAKMAELISEKFNH